MAVRQWELLMVLWPLLVHLFVVVGVLTSQSMLVETVELNRPAAN